MRAVPRDSGLCLIVASTRGGDTGVKFEGSGGGLSPNFCLSSSKASTTILSLRAGLYSVREVSVAVVRGVGAAVGAAISGFLGMNLCFMPARLCFVMSASEDKIESASFNERSIKVPPAGFLKRNCHWHSQSQCGKPRHGCCEVIPDFYARSVEDVE